MQRNFIMKKKVGVVGYGGMGQWHVCSIAGTTYLNAIDFNESDVCEIVAVHDIDPKKNEKARADGYKAYDTLEEFLSDESIEIVVIATPNDVHESIAIAAMDAGKHVICEKPVTMSCESLENMIAASERNNRKFSVHQNRRYDDYFVLMKQLCDEDSVGEIISIESRVHGDHGIPGDWRKTVEKGGGMLYDWGVHMIDQQLWMLGYDVESVYARFDYLTGAPVDDGCYVDIKLRSGKNLHVEIATYNFVKLPLMYMRGKMGTAMINDWKDKIHITRCTGFPEDDNIRPAKTANGLSKTMAPRTDRAMESFDMELPHVDVHDYYRNFCDAIDGKCEQLVTHDQMRVVMKVIMAAFESARTNTVVKF